MIQIRLKCVYDKVFEPFFNAREIGFAGFSEKLYFLILTKILLEQFSNPTGNNRFTKKSRRWFSENGKNIKMTKENPAGLERMIAK